MAHLPTMPTLCNYGKTGTDQLPDRDVLVLLIFVQIHGVSIAFHSRFFVILASDSLLRENKKVQ